MVRKIREFSWRTKKNLGWTIVGVLIAGLAISVKAWPLAALGAGIVALAWGGIRAE